HNDEAYAGALAVLVAMQQTPQASLERTLTAVANQIPDSITRDHLREISAVAKPVTIGAVAQRFGSGGYVADTVPLAVVAAWHMTPAFAAVVYRLPPPGRSSA